MISINLTFSYALFVVRLLHNCYGLPLEGVSAMLNICEKSCYVIRGHATVRL